MSEVFNPAQDLELLFEELVGGQARQKAVKPVVQRLDEALADASVARFIKREVTVTVRAFHRPLTVPFGFQNGRFNVGSGDLRPGRSG